MIWLPLSDSKRTNFKFSWNSFELRFYTLVNAFRVFHATAILRAKIWHQLRFYACGAIDIMGVHALTSVLAANNTTSSAIEPQSNR